MNVFISYSRKDAKFVERLKTALEAGKIGVTIDTESLVFGDDLQEFIERSVRETDLTIAVISRHSLQSVWVIAEALETLMYEKVLGRKKYLPIYIDTSFLDDGLYLQIVEQIDASLATLKDLTVQGMDRHLGTAHLDQKRDRFITLRNNLPAILKKLADVLVADFSSEAKFAENLPKLLEAIAQAETQREQVSGRPSRYLAPFQAPPLPGHFVPRPEVTETLKARLLNNETTTPGILVVSAIHGLGGIGKSTLAAALSYDKDIQQRFPDGILWHTLGQQPEILSILSAWIQTMRDYDFRPTSIEAASVHLRTLLQDKAALLVVDDVWNPEHALPFKVGGPRCQVLITTRRADVADEVGAELHQMDVMTLEQALQLLSARLNRPLDAAEQDEVLALAKAVGYLPLALELAAVRVARGMSWNALQQALEQEVAHLEALEGSARRRRKGETRLEACFNLSLNALRTDDEDAWMCFVWLGVLREDTQIAAPMAATLCDVTREEATGILELLWNDALLMPGTPILVGDQEWPSYRLHDILHDIARKLLVTSQPQGLGSTFQNAHATLLERYQQRTQDGLWHTLSDDGYIHARLTWHFQQAGQIEQVQVLLREESTEGCNGWYQVRERLGQTAGFLEDVNLAWSLAEDTQDIGLQCRYALIIASFNSLAANLPEGLLPALVQYGIWSPAQGLAYARQIQNSKTQGQVLVELSPHLPQHLLSEALQVAQAMKRESDRAKTLIWLAPHLPQLLRTTTLEVALQAAQAIQNEAARAQALTGLAPHLPSPLLKETLQTAQAIQNEAARAQALAGLIPHLPQSLRTTTVEDALRATYAINRLEIDAEALTNTLIGLASHLPEPLRTDTLEDASKVVEGIRDKGDRVKALIGLAPLLPEPLRIYTLEKALRTAQAIDKNEGDRAEVLIGLVPHLLHHLQREALQAVQTIENETERARLLSGLAPHLPEPLRTDTLEEALQAAQAIENETDRARLLSGLAPHLPEPLRTDMLEEALRTARFIRDGYDLKNALAALYPHLPDHLLSETVRTAIVIKDEVVRAEALTGLVPHLSEPLRIATLEDALRSAQAIKNEDYRTKALIELAPHLPHHLLREALQSAQAIESKSSQAKALIELAPHLLHHLPMEALQAAQAIKDEGARAEALIDLAPHLPHHLLREALQATQAIDSESSQAKALIGLAPHLPHHLLKEALQKVKAMIERRTESWKCYERHINDYGECLWGSNEEFNIAVRTLENLRWKALDLREKALQAVLAIKDKVVQAEALTRLFTHWSEALQTPQTIWHKADRAQALSGLAQHLPEPLRTDMLEAALQAAQAIEGEAVRVQALSGLAQHLPEPLRTDTLEAALQATQAIKNEDHRTKALSELAPHLPEPLRTDTLEAALQAAQAIEDEAARAQALTGLAPHLPKPLRTLALEAALQAARAIEYETDRMRALTALATNLPEPLRTTVLKEALQAAKAEDDLTRVLNWSAPPNQSQYERKYRQAMQTMMNELGRAVDLTSLVPHLSQNLLTEALQVAQTFEDKENRSSILNRLVLRLQDLPAEKFLPQWQNFLERSAQRNRENLLSDLRAMTPVIFKLGGQDAIVELFHAIQDVGRWWP